MNRGKQKVNKLLGWESTSCLHCSVINYYFSHEISRKKDCKIVTYLFLQCNFHLVDWGCQNNLKHTYNGKHTINNFIVCLNMTNTSAAVNCPLGIGAHDTQWHYDCQLYIKVLCSSVYKQARLKWQIKGGWLTVHIVCPGSRVGTGHKSADHPCLGSRRERICEDKHGLWGHLL